MHSDTTPMNDHPEYESNAEQYQWLAEGLAASQATWVVVCGHHPIFSSASHGNTPALVNYVLPLLVKCVYCVYICTVGWSWLCLEV